MKLNATLSIIKKLNREVSVRFTRESVQKRKKENKGNNFMKSCEL
jgi:hypothetical protein